MIIWLSNFVWLRFIASMRYHFYKFLENMAHSYFSLSKTVKKGKEYGFTGWKLIT
jgi:hypothetical protein